MSIYIYSSWTRYRYVHQYLCYYFVLSQCFYSHATFTYNVLKPQFEQNFKKTCSIYPFYQTYLERLTHPTGNVVLYHFQLNGWKNGGLGDRLAGLVNGMEISIRFNRTLIIRSDSQFEKLFRPYIPDKLKNDPVWNNISYDRDNLAWTKFNSSWEFNEQTELEMYNCVNNPSKLSDYCTQAWGNPKQPMCTLLGNRVYICKYFYGPEYVPAHQNLMKTIGKENDNLMEAAGCMLRLAMWPTDLTWQYIDETMESHKLDLKRRGLIKHHDQSSLWRNIVSLHFRCGDLGYIHRGAYDIACQHSEILKNETIGNEIKLTYNIPPHSESGYMGYGTTLELARCAQKLLENMTQSISSEWQSFLNDEERNQNFNKLQLRRHLGEVNLNNSNIEFHTIVHIASDNAGSAKQINETLNWPNTFISPSGCHVEMDVSFECLRITVVYWLIMAMSDIIFAPGNNKIPNSSFPKYAAIYGLKGDSLRDVKQCGDFIPLRNLSHIQNGNWNCN